MCEIIFDDTPHVTFKEEVVGVGFLVEPYKYIECEVKCRGKHVGVYRKFDADYHVSIDIKNEMQAKAMELLKNELNF